MKPGIAKASWRAPRREDLPPTVPFLSAELTLDPPDDGDFGEHEFRTYNLELGNDLGATVWTHDGAGGWLGTVDLGEHELARVFVVGGPAEAAEVLGAVFVSAVDLLHAVRLRLSPC